MNFRIELDTQSQVRSFVVQFQLWYCTRNVLVSGSATNHTPLYHVLEEGDRVYLERRINGCEVNDDPSEDKVWIAFTRIVA